jgi:hypothetical protein
MKPVQHPHITQLLFTFSRLLAQLSPFVGSNIHGIHIPGPTTHCAVPLSKFPAVVQCSSVRLYTPLSSSLCLEAAAQLSSSLAQPLSQIRLILGSESTVVQLICSFCCAVSPCNLSPFVLPLPLCLCSSINPFCRRLSDFQHCLFICHQTADPRAAFFLDRSQSIAAIAFDSAA